MRKNGNAKAMSVTIHCNDSSASDVDTSTTLTIQVRRGVLAGAVTSIEAVGDYDGDNAKILNALRSIWIEGHARWGWPALGVDQTREVPVFQRRAYRKKR